MSELRYRGTMYIYGSTDSTEAFQVSKEVLDFEPLSPVFVGNKVTGVTDTLLILHFDFPRNISEKEIKDELKVIWVNQLEPVLNHNRVLCADFFCDGS